MDDRCNIPLTITEENAVPLDIGAVAYPVYPESYKGSYNIVPSLHQQIVKVKGLYATKNIVVEKIPDSYFGLVYETGTWTPAQDIANHIISFSGTHTAAPWYYMIYDATGSYSSATASNYFVSYQNWHQVFGEPIYINNTGGYRYGEVRTLYRSSAVALTAAAINITQPYTSSENDSTSCSRYWATETGIKAYINNNTRYWRANRTYKWVAVWAPTR